MGFDQKKFSEIKYAQLLVNKLNLKNIQNILSSKNMDHLLEKILYYYTMGEEKWKKSDIWPPLGHSMQRWLSIKNCYISIKKMSLNSVSWLDLL